MDLIFQLTLLLTEEEKARRKEELKHLRDNANPFQIDKNIFRQYFRISKQMADTIIMKLDEYNNEPSDIPFPFRVLSTLYFLGHGSYQKCVAANYLLPMSQSSISRNISYILKLITTKLAEAIQFCEEQEQKNLVKEGFYSKFGMKSVIGAIDCTHVAIVAPPANDAERPARLYLNRKGYYSINVEAIVDSNLKFLSVNAKYPGSVHDSAIWTTSPGRVHLIREHNSRSNNWLIGDSGYPLEPWLLTPVSQPTSRQEEKFNAMQIRARNSVERAFGVLKSRFRCVHKNRVLHYRPDKAAIIFYSCAILHNMMVDCGLNDEHDDDVIYDEEDPGANISDHDSSYLVEGRHIRNEYINTL